jgi:hypothetical protein
MYSLLDALDILWSKNSAEKQSDSDRGNEKRIIYPSYQLKKCDNQCVNCSLLFCLRELA